MYISNSINIFLQYVLVSLVIVFSGSLIPFIWANNYSDFLIYFLIFIAFLTLILREVRFNANGLVYLICITLLLIFLFFFRGDFANTKEYIGTFGRLLIAYLITALIDKRKFISIYTDLFFYYSSLSILMFGLGFIYQDLILSLPISNNDAGTGYRHLYIYFYQGIDSWNYRNAGIFWEAGAYQVFLSIALIFEGFLIKKSLIREIVLMGAIITTVSTVGFLVLGLILIFRSFTQKSFRNLTFLALIIFLLFVFADPYSLIFGKFDGENISGVDRLVGQLADLKLFFNAPFFGNGYLVYPESFKALAYSLGSITPTSSNSFTGLLALNGFFYSLIVFVPMLAFFIKMPLNKTNRFFITSIFILLLCSQGLFNQILFLTFIFYSFVSPKFSNINNSLGGIKT